MDEEVLNIINNLTTGKYAEEYFAKCSLNAQDVEKIKEVLTNNIINLQADSQVIEQQLEKIIKEYCEMNNLSVNFEDQENSYDEKLMIYKLNANNHNIICTNCQKELIKDFKYCPYCGKENIQITLKIVVDGNIDLEKGYVTPEEVKHIRFLTSDEEKAVNEGKVKFNDVGVALDETNSPYEIKNQLISKNESLLNNLTEREKLFNQNRDIHKKQVTNYKLSVFEDMDKIRSLKIYPLSVTENKKDSISEAIIKEENASLIKPDEKKKKYIKVISNPSYSKTKELMKEKDKTSNEDENLRNVEDLKINLKYAGVLYLIDAIKHPKDPEISKNMMYSLNIYSKSEVIEYLRKKNYIKIAKGMDLIKANLRELKENDLINILKSHNIKVGKNKDDNIQRICENVDRKSLEQYNMGNAVIVTNNGYQFVDNNPQVEVYSKYLYNINFKSFEQYYTQHEDKFLIDVTLDFLADIREHFIEKMKWNKYCLTFNSESMIYKDKKDKLMQLKSYINYFISLINPWDDNKLNNPNLLNINAEELIKIVDKSGLSFKQIEEIFMNQALEIKIPYFFITANEAFEYFKRIYDKEDIRIISNKLSEKINLKGLEVNSYEFFYKKEQEELINKIKEGY